MNCAAHIEKSEIMNILRRKEVLLAGTQVVRQNRATATPELDLESIDARGGSDYAYKRQARYSTISGQAGKSHYVRR